MSRPEIRTGDVVTTVLSIFIAQLLIKRYEEWRASR